MNKSDFRFYTDDFQIKKAKDKDGNDILRIAGIASKEERDSQGEVLKIDGMDLTSFKNGFVNFNHFKSPEYIIGQITKAEKRGKELYVEAELFGELEKARAAYKLTEILEKRKSDRRMQFSIEGKALERDPMDQGVVSKSKLTNIALTLNPINGSTLAQIMKGEVSFEDSLEDPEFSKSEDGFIVDVIDDSGNRITVDKSYNIEVTKAATTTSHEALIPESVDKDMKVQEYEEKKLSKSFFINDKQDNFTSVLKKSEIYDFFFKAIPNIDIESAKRLYQILENQNDKDTMAITKEELQKAFDNLESLASMDIEKGADGGEMTPINFMKSCITKGMSKDDMMKAMKEKYDDMDEEEMEKMYESNFAKKDDSEVKKSEENSELEEIKAKLEKAEAELAEIKKAEDNESDNFEKSISSINKSVAEGFSQVNEILKSFAEDNTNLKDALEKSEQNYQDLANKSQAPKSIQTKNYIQKADDVESENKLNINVPEHRKYIIQKADELIDWNAVESGDKLEKSYGEEVSTFGFGGGMGATMRNRLIKAGIQIEG